MAVGLEDWQRTALTAPPSSAVEGKKGTSYAQPEDDQPSPPLRWSFDLETPLSSAQPTTSLTPGDSAPVAGTSNGGLRAGLGEAKLLLSNALLDDILGFDPLGNEAAPAPEPKLSSNPTVPLTTGSATTTGGEGPSAGPVRPAGVSSEAASAGPAARSHGEIAPLLLNGGSAVPPPPSSSPPVGTLSGSGGSGGTIGNFVWEDPNENGIQEDGEPGVGGVVVGLYNAAGFRVASDTTDSNGHYQFDGLAAGDYYLVFSAPAGRGFAFPYNGESSRDSDVNPRSGRTDWITLAPDGFRDDIDAGLIVVNGLSLVGPESQTYVEGEQVQIELGVRAVPGHDIYFDAVGLPEGVGINPQTGTITGTLPEGTAGEYAVTVTATDLFLSVSVQATLTLAVLAPGQVQEYEWKVEEGKICYLMRSAKFQAPGVTRYWLELTVVVPGLRAALKEGPQPPNIQIVHAIPPGKGLKFTAEAAPSINAWFDESLRILMSMGFNLQAQDTRAAWRKFREFCQENRIELPNTPRP